MEKKYKHKVVIKKWFNSITVESNETLEDIKKFIDKINF